ncbi:MAG: ABC transporter permease [Candidatus Latescibacteria bacterium]|nr:ABC transporter permease [Candidatus Latescibacterota bacterium]
MLKNYIKIAFKVFLRRRFFTFVSLFGICFTLTVLMIVAAFIDYQIAPYPPENKADRTLKISEVILIQGLAPPAEKNVWTGNVGVGVVEQCVRQMETPEKISLALRPNRVAVSYKDDEEFKLELKATDAAYWEILEFEFIEGRPFTAQEVADRSPVAVINEATRKRIFDGRPAAGRTLETLTGRYRVVGVVENVPRFSRTAFADIWVPLDPSESNYPELGNLFGSLEVLLLARSRVDFPRIKEELRTNIARVDLSVAPGWEVIHAYADTPLEQLTRTASPTGYEREDTGEGQFRVLGSLTVAALLFMLLPALNLINLNSSRILERAPEIGVRKAFGASSRGLVGQFVVENLLLTLIGGVLSFVLSSLLLTMLSRIGFGWFAWSEYAEFRLNYRVFCYGLGCALVLGLLSGVYPAWRMSRLHPAEALRGGQR